MVDFRVKSRLRIPRKLARSMAQQSGTRSYGVEKRRGIRVNSRVPVALEWDSGAQSLRKEAHTCVVGPYGCMVILPQNLELEQKIRLTNLVSHLSNPGVVVWRGAERPEGFELGIELINPQMGFWGLEL